MIIVTLTKLLVISIVANVRSLSSSNNFIFLSISVLPELTSDISDGRRLKKAISEPLANPDTRSRSTVNKRATATPMEGVMKCMSDKDSIIGKVSKTFCFIKMANHPSERLAYHPV